MTTMVCPLCGRQHPTGTMYCPVTWSGIPEGTVRDPFAGRPPAKTLCLPCAQSPETPTVALGGARASSPPPTAEPEVPAAEPTLLRLPSGESVGVPRGTEVLIGRKSEIPGIGQALEPFDMVGRYHCYMKVSPDGDAVMVRDPGSTNGTWVGDCPERVAPDEERMVALPVRIRLGRHLCVIVEREGSGQ